MSTAIPARLEFSENDRFGLSFFGSLLVHLVIILGVTFVLPRLTDLEGLPTMEITLVQTHSDRAPEDAEFLAQANQQGGGSSDQPDRARSPLPTREIGEQLNPVPVYQAPPQPRVASRKQADELLAQERARERIAARDPEPERQQQRRQRLNPGLLSAPDRARERSRLNAEISRFWQNYQQQPRRKYLNASSAREYKYAAYMDAWRAKVERVGNLNYPEEARRRGLSGNLVLDVALNPDGSIHSTTVRRSSGIKVLDDAAIRIVTLAAPFAPFPANIRSDVDILHITRTWKFNEEGWSSKR